MGVRWASGKVSCVENEGVIVNTKIEKRWRPVTENAMANNGLENSDGDGGTVFVYNRLDGGGGEEEKKVYVALLMS